MIIVVGILSVFYLPLILAIAIANIKVHKIQLIVIVIFVIASLTDLIAELLQD
jgi:hypothetical protein